jgi:hypothetical protein
VKTASSEENTRPSEPSEGEHLLPEKTRSFGRPARHRPARIAAACGKFPSAFLPTNHRL